MKIEKLFSFVVIVFGLAICFLGTLVHAQGMMSGMCPMCGAMGWGSMLLSALIGIALLALIVAGIVYLVKKTRQLPH